jgi:hypothetical protein
VKECSRRLWERIFAGGGGKGGAEGEFANHRCVQVDEEGGPSNNFLGHEIAFYEGEILLGQPVKKHLFKSVCTMYIFVRNSERRRRDFWRMKVTYLRAETKV